MSGPSTWKHSPHRADWIPLPQSATDGAFDILVDGHRHNDVSKILFGLNLLCDASPDGIAAAIVAVEARHHMTRAEIDSMIAA